MVGYRQVRSLDRFLAVLICHRLFARKETPVVRDICVPVALEDVLYIWRTGNASTSKISADWAGSYELAPHRVYARTRHGLYMLSQRTLDGLADGLGFPFEPGGRSLLVNLREIKWFQYDQGSLRLGFISDNGLQVEYTTLGLPHSRRIYRMLRRFHRALSARSRVGDAPAGSPERDTANVRRIRESSAPRLAFDAAVDDEDDDEDEAEE